MNRLFTLEHFPYLFTIVISVIAFQFNYLIKSTLETPTVEYDLKQISEETDDTNKVTVRKYACEIVNISKNTSFENVILNILFKEDIVAEILNPDFEAVPPSALLNVDKESLNNLIIQYKIARLQPWFKYIFTFTTKMNKGEHFLPDLYFQSKDTITIKKRSLLTWLVKNQSFVNIIIILTLVAVMIPYLVLISRRRGSSNND